MRSANISCACRTRACVILYTNNMPISFIIAGLALLLLLGVLAYWQLIVAEGAYLGAGVVTYLYDQFAPHYDKTKQFNPQSDALQLAGPVLTHNPASSVLDVATGTGRLPAALLLQPKFTGSIVAVDSSARMLDIARGKLAIFGDRVDLQLRDASALPYPDASFDTVTCLEALEFMPQPSRVNAEMLRVLKPGGLLIISNRIGPDAWKLPGRARSTAALIAELTALGAKRIESDEWLLDYDLVYAWT